MILMWLVKAIDIAVGAVMFLFSKQRRHNPSVPMALGTVGTVALIMVLLIAVGAPRVAYQVRTDAYTAEMANASGLTPGDPVYVAGVPAGQIGTIDLAGDHV
ncbi:MAG TPA: MlaD family protein, partial [Mycobacterium sp.]|nr:MlaD family protein [Mycobacterium sp.]